MIIVVTQPDNNNAIQTLSYSSTAVAGSTFGCTASSLSGQDQEAVTIALATGVGANQKITLEIRPPKGAALPFARTAPSVIAKSQALN
jgi:archaellin